MMILSPPVSASHKRGQNRGLATPPVSRVGRLLGKRDTAPRRIVLPTDSAPHDAHELRHHRGKTSARISARPRVSRFFTPRTFCASGFLPAPSLPDTVRCIHDGSGGPSR